MHDDQPPHFAASDLGLHCLPMSLKKTAMLIWVNCNQIIMLLMTSRLKSKHWPTSNRTVVPTVVTIV